MVGFLRLILILIVFCIELSEGKQAYKNESEYGTVNVVNHIATNKQPVNRATTECKDKAQNCRQLLGQCNDPSYVNILKANCQLTCGYCKRPSTKCENAFPDATCQKWKTQRYCESTAPLQQKRAYCSKTCNLCEGATLTIDCSKPINKNKPECKENSPSIDCNDPANKNKEECKANSPTINCNDPNNKNKPECKRNSPDTDDKCDDENDLKSLVCLRSNCQDIKKFYTPECLHFCQNKQNKKNEWACKCAKNLNSDDKCMPKFCKSNPEDTGCQNFCDLEENKNVPECVCVKNRVEKSCLIETCKDFAKYGTYSGCVSFCTKPENKEEQPTCLQYGTATVCSNAADKFKLACLKSDPNDADNAKKGTSCVAAPDKDNINCQMHCEDPKYKFTVNCIDCAVKENKFHFNCLATTCADALNKNDSTCKTYCKKVKNSAQTPC